MDRHERLDRLLHGQPCIHDVQEQLGALEMREEVETEAMPLSGSLEQPRDVHDGDLTVNREIDNAKHRLDRRKRVIRNLRRGIRDATQER